jgi:hypothetical protein
LAIVAGDIIVKFALLPPFATVFAPHKSSPRVRTTEEKTSANLGLRELIVSDKLQVAPNGLFLIIKQWVELVRSLEARTHLNPNDKR